MVGPFVSRAGIAKLQDQLAVLQAKLAAACLTTLRCRTYVAANGRGGKQCVTADRRAEVALPDDNSHLPDSNRRSPRERLNLCLRDACTDGNRRNETLLRTGRLF